MLSTSRISAQRLSLFLLLLFAVLALAGCGGNY